MAVILKASAYALPEGRLTHAQLQARFGADQMDRLIENTGILERRVCSEDECASDLAYRAAVKVFEETGTNPDDIDLVILATQMPDYLLPTTACILQKRLGIPTTAAAFDVNLGCSQFVYGQSIGFAMLESGLAKKALVMTADTPSRIVNPKDRGVVPLFGDAGTATVLEYSDAAGGFLDFGFGTDGGGAEALIWPTSGMRQARSADGDLEVEDKFGSIRTQNDMFMDGQAIFIFTLKTVPGALKSFLQKNELDVADVDFFLFHQASKMIVDSIVKKMKIPEDKFNRIYENRGNSGGSTVGIALVDAINSGRIKPGDTVVLSAFGVGLSWAQALYKVPDELPACFAIE